MAIDDLPTKNKLDEYTGSAGEGGLVPIPGSNLGLFLRDDGTWWYWWSHGYGCWQQWHH